MLASSTPSRAVAEGFNDWVASTLEPGAVSFGPTVQLRLRPEASLYVQMQVLVGLGPGVDMIISPAAWLQSSGVVFDSTWIQPRIQVAGPLTLSPGFSVQGSETGLGTGWLPGVFFTVGEAWMLNLNLIATLPFAAPTEGAQFLVCVGQRKLNDTTAVYVELDVWREHGQVNGPTLQGFVGTQLELGEMGSLNLSLAWPLGRDFSADQVALGVWWATEFQVRPRRLR